MRSTRRASRGAGDLWESLEASAREVRHDRATCRRSARPVSGRLAPGGRDDRSADERSETAAPIRPLRRLPPIRDALATLRANLTLESTAFRHAVRLAVTLAIATAWYRLAALAAGYWLPMTALLVLKPEFQGTFATGLARVAGTLLGAVGATLLTVALALVPLTLIALALGFVWCGYAFLRTNYTIFVFCMTGYVVCLLAIAGLPERGGGDLSSRDTALGGMLALLVYAAWPTWEGAHVRQASPTCWMRIGAT